MPNMSMTIKHTIRKARRSYMCSRSECTRDIVKGEQYMEVKEYRQTYRWCLDCFYTKLR